MSAWDGLNRRRFPRVRYPCMVVIRQGAESAETLLTHTENLGTGGVCVIIKKQLKLFSPVAIEVDLMDMQDHVRCQGKVVWSIHRKNENKAKQLFYDVGIEFLNLTAHDQKRIDGIVRHISTHKERIIPYSS